MKIAILSSFPPKSCGVGEFCFDLVNSLKKNDPDIKTDIYAIDNIPEGYNYSSLVKNHFFYQNRADYEKMANIINEQSYDFCLIQHEFGLFGGEKKEFLFDFTNKIKIPLIVILHSIPIDPNRPKYELKCNHILELDKKTNFFVSISKIGKTHLEKLGIDSKKIIVIPHGAPDELSNQLSIEKRNKLREKLSIKENFFVVSMIGLIHKEKGIEYLLEALLIAKEKIKNIRALIIGVTLLPEYEPYFNSIKDLITKLKLEKDVILLERYLEKNELYEFIKISDVIVTPYLNKNQASSGIAAFSIAAGIPVISTPFPYAQELLADIGKLVPFKDSKAIADELIKLAEDKNYYKLRQKKTIMLGKNLFWSNIAKEYLKLFKKIV
jgi:glycosyltransferase involved in cell wall biosynthesis